MNCSLEKIEERISTELARVAKRLEIIDKYAELLGFEEGTVAVRLLWKMVREIEEMPR